MHDQDARTAATGAVNEVQLARHAAVLKKMAQLKPELDQAELRLQRLTEHFGRVSKLARSCDNTLPEPAFQTLKARESQARAKLAKFCADATLQLEQIRARASHGKSTQVSKLETDCLTKLAKLCLERDRALNDSLRALPKTLTKLHLDLSENVNFLAQFCELRGPARFASLRQRLMRLDVTGDLRRFVESRAGFVLALHLYHRLQALLDWTPPSG